MGRTAMDCHRDRLLDANVMEPQAMAGYNAPVIVHLPTAEVSSLALTRRP
jgi:hypothetical protein